MYGKKRGFKQNTKKKKTIMPTLKFTQGEAMLLKALKSIIVGTLGFLLCACSYPDMYYKVEGEAPVDKTKPLAVAYAGNNNGVEEKNFKKMLELTLKKYGYHLQQANDGQKPCVMLFDLTESTHDMIGSYTSYNTSTTFSSASGWVGGRYVTASGSSTTTTPQTNTYSYQVTFKKIYTSVGCPDGSGHYDGIWDGFMSAERSDYDENKENAVANLVELMGEKTFKGNLRIDTDKHVPFLRKDKAQRHYLTLGGDVAFALGSANFGKFYGTDRFWGSLQTYDTSEVLPLMLPITLRVGYLYDTKKNLAFGINAVYSTDNVFDASDTEINLSLNSKKAGFEATMLIKDKFLIGLGVAKNINSTATINIDGYSYKAQYERAIDSTYGLWRLEYLYNLPATHLYFTTGFNGSWSFQDINYMGNMFGMSAGLFYKL